MVANDEIMSGWTSVFNKNSAVVFDTWFDYLRLSGDHVWFNDELVVFSEGKKLLGCWVAITHMIFSN